MTIFQHPKEWTMADLFLACCLFFGALAAVFVTFALRAQDKERTECLSSKCRVGEPMFMEKGWECLCVERPRKADGH